MKKDMNSVKDVKLNELKEYVLNFKISNKEKVLCSWSMKSLLKVVSLENSLYDQCLQRLYSSKNYNDMEYNLVMMNILFSHYEFQTVKHDLLMKLFEMNIGLDEYQVIRHLIDFNDISFEYFIERLHRLNTSLLVIAKICLLEDEYELAYQYLKQMEYCHDQVVLDLLCQYSPSLYCRLEFHYYSKRKQKILFQKMS